MAKYTFSHGKVGVEDGMYVPIPRKNRRLARTGVLVVIPNRSHAEEHSESTLSMNKENAHEKH